jgi:hypothetical protein
MRANGEEGTTASTVAIATLQPPDAGTSSGSILVKDMSEPGFSRAHKQLEDTNHDMTSRTVSDTKFAVGQKVFLLNFFC